MQHSWRIGDRNPGERNLVSRVQELPPLLHKVEFAEEREPVSACLAGVCHDSIGDPIPTLVHQLTCTGNQVKPLLLVLRLRMLLDMLTKALTKSRVCEERSGRHSPLREQVT